MLGVAKAKSVPVQIKEALGYAADEDDAMILAEWKARTSRVCKPCWELKYCPYGPLVEDSPLLPNTRADAVEHHEYLKGCLESGTVGVGEAVKPLEDDRRQLLQEMVDRFDPEEHPAQIPAVIADAQCRIFGHICPVVYAAEPFTETPEIRDTGRRSLPFKARMRVARRDNYTCQVCGIHLSEDDMEFDHIIPVAKAGRTRSTTCASPASTATGRSQTASTSFSASAHADPEPESRASTAVIAELRTPRTALPRRRRPIGVHIPHRRRHVGMPKHRLHVGESRRGDRTRSEGRDHWKSMIARRSMASR